MVSHINAIGAMCYQIFGKVFYTMTYQYSSYFLSQYFSQFSGFAQQLETGGV